jgi:hypothetical protein
MFPTDAIVEVPGTKTKLRAAPVALAPEVASYRGLRQSVGIVAFALPFALALPVAVGRSWIHPEPTGCPPLIPLVQHWLEDSISGYYYTFTRNFFVGSLCAIALLMGYNKGYDLRDAIAGRLSAVCALGVAFFPVAPNTASTLQKHISNFHYAFAGVLFSILAYFCLVLFKMTAVGKHVTRKKLQRNLVYTICGWIIVGSIVTLGLLKALAYFKVFNIESLGKNLHHIFWLESIALLAFGFAWLVKGETILRDEQSAQGGI